MGQVNGTFIYNGRPQNGASAKLWKKGGLATYTDSGDTVQDNPLSAAATTLNVSDGTNFAVDDVIRIEDEHLKITAIVTNALTVIRGYDNTTAAEHAQSTIIYDVTYDQPAQDDAEPESVYQQGSTITTGVAYGGDGQFRWNDVPDGEYYVSCYYDGHRAWMYVTVEASYSDVLQARGDMITRGAGAAKRLPKGSEGEFLKMGADEPEWAAAGGWIFYELAGQQNHQVSSTSTWEDWDLSAIVPAGTKAVLVEIKIHYSSNQVSGVRQNGSAQSRIQSTGTPTATHEVFRDITTLVDDNRVIECYGSLASAYLHFSILGYWS